MPGNPVMCIGMRACKPIAINWTKSLNCMRRRVRHRNRAIGYPKRVAFADPVNDSSAAL
jgi:hypothetical protein